MKSEFEEDLKMMELYANNIEDTKHAVEQIIIFAAEADGPDDNVEYIWENLTDLQKDLAFFYLLGILMKSHTIYDQEDEDE